MVASIGGRLQDNVVNRLKFAEQFKCNSMCSLSAADFLAL